MGDNTNGKNVVAATKVYVRATKSEYEILIEQFNELVNTVSSNTLKQRLEFIKTKLEEFNKINLTVGSPEEAVVKALVDANIDYIGNLKNDSSFTKHAYLKGFENLFKNIISFFKNVFSFIKATNTKQSELLDEAHSKIKNDIENIFEPLMNNFEEAKKLDGIVSENRKQCSTRRDEVKTLIFDGESRLKAPLMKRRASLSDISSSSKAKERRPSF